MLEGDSVIAINANISAADALRAYLVLGRTNGYIKGFGSSLYVAISDALDIDSFSEKHKLQLIASSQFGVIDYNQAQQQAEKIFFGNSKARNELAVKMEELEKLQSEINELKEELGED